MLLQHVRQHRMYGIDGSEKIDVDDLLDCFRFKRSSLGIISADTRVRDEDIYPAEFSAKIVRGFRDSGRVSHIARKDTGNSTGNLTSRCEITQLLFSTCEKSQRRATFCECDCESFTDTARGTGKED